MFKIKSRNSSIKRGLILGTAATCLSLTLVPSAFADNIAVFDEQPDTNLNTNLNTNLYAQYEELLKEENNKFEDNLDKRFGLTTLWESVARSWNSEIYEKEKNSDELNASIYRGFQNPSQYYQVSNESVTIKNQGDGEFGFRQESRIGIDATREECIETMIEVAYEYLDANTPYIWDYACAPGVGVDCAGLVLQCLYATGMDLTTHEQQMNPWDHYYTPGHDHYAVWMRETKGFKHVALEDRQRGDLVFYEGHVAIYLGNDEILDAYPPKVRTTSIWTHSYPIAIARPFVE